MHTGTNWRTIGLFLLAIGWPWLVVPLLAVLGLLSIAGLAQVLIALLVMPAPAVAALVTSRLMHRGRLSQDGLRLLGVNWRAVAVVPLAFTLFALLYLLLLLQMSGNVGHLPGVGQLDVHGAAIVENLRRLNPELPTTAIKLPPDGLLIPLFIGGALLAGVSINALFAIGEELGWRGLLLTGVPIRSSARPPAWSASPRWPSLPSCCTLPIATTYATSAGSPRELALREMAEN